MIYTVENTAAIGKRKIVRLNGKLVKNCFYADDDKGIVKSRGRHPKVNKVGDLVEYINRGRVEVFDV